MDSPRPGAGAGSMYPAAFKNTDQQQIPSGGVGGRALALPHHPSTSCPNALTFVTFCLSPWISSEDRGD